MVERESSCLNPVRSHGRTALGSVVTTLKPHEMEDFYVTDHEVEIKMKYIYSTQLTRLLSSFVFASLTLGR